MIKLVECNTSAGYQGIKDKNDNNLYFVKETRQLFKGLYEYCPYPSVYSGDSTPGLVPAKVGNTQTKYLREDGTWQVPPDTKYSLSIASKTQLGGVKIGGNISITTDGTISITSTNITDALGYTPPESDTTYKDFVGATSTSSGKSGLVPAPSSGASDRYLRSDGQWGVPTNTTYGVFTTGKSGLVPAPSSADAGKFLRGDGTWQEASGGSSQYVLPQATGAALGGIKVGYDPQGSTDYAVQLDPSGNAYVNISLKVVTKSNDGLMTSEMLEKLNSLSTDDGSID